MGDVKVQSQTWPPPPYHAVPPPGRARGRPFLRLLDGLDAFAALRQTPEYLEGALANERTFIDLTRVEWMATADHVILDGPAGGSLVKGVWRLKRRPGMALADFRRYWIDVHGKLALALPGLRRYVQSHLIDEAYLYAEPRHDGVAQLWFDSPAALAAAFDSPAGKELQADGSKMLDMRLLRFFLAEEHVVIASRCAGRGFSPFPVFCG